MGTDDDDIVSERSELHFLAALVDELMRKLMTSGAMSQSDLNEIEQNVANRLGSVPRAW